MANWIALIILAIVQGIAEWFPISSSGHLVLVSKLLGYDNTLVLDVALHLGTLMAVFVYFGKDIMNILRDVLSCKFETENGKLGLFLIVATIPAAFFGYLFSDFLDTSLNNLYFLVGGLAITSVLLFIASIDKRMSKHRNLSLGIALIIGFAQVFSLFRGISRSGSTICAGLFAGLSERMAARFSFLLSIPVIFGASLLTITKHGGSLSPDYLVAAFVSFLVGLATIHFLLGFVLTSRKNLRWFGLYVALLATSLALYLVFS
jgi:undecaprenyl-diphosphatase